MNLNLHAVPSVKQDSKSLCLLFLSLLYVIGLCMGHFLECFHNHVLLLQNGKGVLLSTVSEYVVTTFRSCNSLHLTTGYGSSIASVFNVFNLLIALLLCFLIWKAKPYGALLLAFSYAANLLMFFFFLFCLGTPLMDVNVIMGAGESENIEGDTWVANSLCLIEKTLFWILLLILFIVIYFLIKKIRFKTK
jgi:hypothetical protein